jgi:TonB family protein
LILDSTVKKGWGFSLGLHFLLLLFLLAYKIELPPFILDFTPVNFAPLGEQGVGEEGTLQALHAGTPMVELPRRPMLDETSPLLQLPDRARPPVEAVIPDERPVDRLSDMARPGKRLTLPSDLSGLSSRPAAAPLPVESSWLEGERQQAMSAKLTGDEVFSINWEGTARQKISGDLPLFPPGLKRDATIQLSFNVAADGTVTLAVPITKGLPELEKASLDAIRKWRFNALDPSTSQTIQKGEITFHYKLK